MPTNPITSNNQIALLSSSDRDTFTMSAGPIRKAGKRMTEAIAPETACNEIGSVSFASLRVTNMINANATATNNGNRAGKPTSAKLG